MAASARTVPLLVTGLVALAALAAAAWLVFFAPQAGVEDQAALPVPEEPAPTPLMKPETP